MWDGIVVESSVIDRSSVGKPISECMQNSNIIVFVFVTNLLKISGDKHRLLKRVEQKGDTFGAQRISIYIFYRG